MKTPPRRSAWLSRGFEELSYRLARKKDAGACDYDVVIVGSGYGGAIAAAQLAGAREKDGGRKISVCVLERGKEYLPGMFPTRMSELAGHVRFSTDSSSRPRGRREGLFDVRIGPDVCAMVANGLGGGSLINAGVMEIPSDAAFEGWPAHVGQALGTGGFYERAKAWLGAADAMGDNTVARHPKGAVHKHQALRRLAGDAPFRDAAVTIAMADRTSSAGVERHACRLCGDCATGCNYEAKESLDSNLLVTARLRGARIFTGATVLQLARAPDADLWLLDVVHTDAHLRKRQKEPIKLRARKVILAAGTFGSTEILLRSRGLQLSGRLGTRFSANGDAIATVYRESAAVNAAADEAVAADARGVGPTITGIVDLRTAQDCLIEDLAIPGALRRAFEEVVTTTNALHDLAEADWAAHASASPAHDPCAVSAAAVARTSVLAVISRDAAKGKLELVDDDKRGLAHDEGDGAIRVRWPELKDAEFYKRQQEILQALAPHAGGEARVLANPLWQMLPAKMQFLLENRHGPALTVHPLGGCPLGRNAGEGVVDEFGQVFKGGGDAASSETWPGLAVLDGSVVPASLGTNPALTIAAFALRAVEALREHWAYVSPAQTRPRRLVRPRFAQPGVPTRPRATEVEMIERMSGRMQLAGKGGAPLDCTVEVTLKFQPVALADLFLPQGGRHVALPRKLAVRDGKLRVFRHDEWKQLREQLAPDEDLEAQALLSAPVRGTLQFLHREPSGFLSRIWRGFWAYVLNRGLRDTWQWLFGPSTRGEKQAARRSKLLGAVDRLLSALKLASRAGEVRLWEYRLDIASPEFSTGGKSALDASLFKRHARLHGKKRLTYGRRSNPWRQLMRMELVQFPGLRPEGGVLELDLKYLAHEGVPLLRIVGQQDQVSALADFASFAGYFTRLLLNVHVWSFRKPDAAPPHSPKRLPGIVPGLPHPEIHEIDVATLAGSPVRVRLTRYKPRDASGLPVVLVHGYSASGTTFAHPAVRPNLAEQLCGDKRDAWIVDLRTSSGMPHARHPWTFEDGASDLKQAVEAVCKLTGAHQVDVFAHCMGAAMFSMAVFKGQEDAFAKRIHKAVLSQIGPRVVMSPANTFRGYVMSYVRHYLDMDDYDFRVAEDPGLADQLLDRLLATLPYPEEEFDIENPKWPPWKRTPFVGTRHRMDALYGRDFSLAAKDGRQLIDDRTLEYIDDLFGPLSVETVSQAIQFARFHAVADPRGNVYYSRNKAKERWTFPTLSIHGEENDLADVATLAEMDRHFVRDAGLAFRPLAFPGFGHQDSLIGRDATPVFRAVSQFLKE